VRSTCSPSSTIGEGRTPDRSSKAHHP
jgi:hypothetical protein